MEQVHAHLAKATVPPHQPDPQIPVYRRPSKLKLMAKNAGDRYQSSSGNPCSLYIFSDRVYEIAKASGNIWRFDEFAKFMRQPKRQDQSDMCRLFECSKTLNHLVSIDDYFTIMKFVFLTRIGVDTGSGHRAGILKWRL